ncbi:unnamed protein product, partial [Pleuronectes platessa]
SQRSKMGGKLSKKKKGFNVTDDKAKDKDATAEGASAEESEAPKENKDEAPAATDAKEVANDTAAKEAPAADTAAAKDEDKNAAPAAKEPEKPAANAEPKAEAPKSAEPAKAEEKPAAPAPAKESAPAPKEPEAKAAAPAPAAEIKDEADAKKTEAPAAPAAKAETAPAATPDPKPTEAPAPAPAKEAAAAPSSTPAAEPPAKEANATEAPSKDQTSVVFSAWYLQLWSPSFVMRTENGRLKPAKALWGRIRRRDGEGSRCRRCFVEDESDPPVTWMVSVQGGSGGFSPVSGSGPARANVRDDKDEEAKLMKDSTELQNSIKDQVVAADARVLGADLDLRAVTALTVHYCEDDSGRQRNVSTNQASASAVIMTTNDGITPGTFLCEEASPLTGRDQQPTAAEAGGGEWALMSYTSQPHRDISGGTSMKNLSVGPAPHRAASLVQQLPASLPLAVEAAMVQTLA